MREKGGEGEGRAAWKLIGPLDKALLIQASTLQKDKIKAI